MAALKGAPRYVKTVASNVEVAQGPHSDDMGGYLERTVDTTTGLVVFSVTNTGVATSPITATQLSQKAEATYTPVLSVQPFTAGDAPFVIATNSFVNTAGGAGTFNHGMWLGWNGALHAQGTSTTGKPGLMMGFEDNFYDTSVSAFTMEWYVEYFSPDHTSEILFRPFYCRIAGTDANTASNSTIHMDIGTDTTGILGVFAGLANPALLTVSSVLLEATIPMLLTGNGLTLSPASGQAVLVISSTNPTVQFEIQGTTAWYWQALSVNNYTVSDKNARAHITLTQGATAAAAVTALSSTLTVAGSVGFYGHAAATQPTVTGAKGSNVALGSLIAALVGQGLILDTTT